MTEGAGRHASRTQLTNRVERKMRQLTQSGQQRFDQRVRPYDLSVPQYLALAAIVQLGPAVGMSDVGDAIQSPPSSMTTIVNRLVALGFVERVRPEQNRRAVVATATPAGAEVVRKVEAVRHEDVIVLLGEMSEDDIAQFMHILDRLNQAMYHLVDSGSTREKKRKIPTE